MKIVLAALNASYVHTNLAVRCIAAALCDAGHTAVIKNLDAFSPRINISPKLPCSKSVRSLNIGCNCRGVRGY